jgi:hypothetical protein
VNGTIAVWNALSINASAEQENVGRNTTEGCALMGIIDPDIIAFLQNYRQAQQGGECKVQRSLGLVLVDSLRRSMMTAPALEPVAA